MFAVFQVLVVAYKNKYMNSSHSEKEKSRGRKQGDLKKKNLTVIKWKAVVDVKWFNIYVTDQLAIHSNSTEFRA